MRFIPRAAAQALTAAGLILGSACSDEGPTQPPDGQGSGAVPFSVSTLAAPANDDFDNATVIPAIPFTETVSIAEATVAADDRLEDERCDPIGGNTIWYSFTPDRDLRLNAGVVNNRPEVLLHAYTGTRGNLTLVGCSSGPLPVVFDATAGTTYHFMIGSDAFDPRPPGTLTFTLQLSLEVSITIDPVATLTRGGLTTFSGTVHCSRPAFADLSGGVVRRGEEIAGISTAFNCDGTTSWTAELQNGDGLRIVPGEVEVSMGGLFTDGSAEEVHGQAEPTTVTVKRVGGRD